MARAEKPPGHHRARKSAPTAPLQFQNTRPPSSSQNRTGWRSFHAGVPANSPLLRRHRRTTRFAAAGWGREGPWSSRLALAQPDLLEHSEDGLGILRHAELGQLLRLLTQAGEAGQQVEIPGGIGSGNSEKEDELHRPGAPGAPNDWLRRASESKLQPLDPTQPRVWKGHAAAKR